MEAPSHRSSAAGWAAKAWAQAKESLKADSFQAADLGTGRRKNAWRTELRIARLVLNCHAPPRPTEAASEPPEQAKGSEETPGSAEPPQLEEVIWDECLASLPGVMTSAGPTLWEVLGERLLRSC